MENGTFHLNDESRLNPDGYDFGRCCFSIIRAQQPTSDFKEYISSISSVKAIDDYTIEIKTKDQIQFF